MSVDLSNAQVVSDRTLDSLGLIGIVSRPAETPAENWGGFDLLGLRRLEASEGESPEAVTALRQDAEALQSLDHPNVLRVLGVTSYNNADYAAMEWTDGSDIKTMIARKELQLNQAIYIARACASGLAAIIATTGMHRDFCTATIVVTRTGVPKIIPLACPADLRVEHRASPTAFYRGAPQCAAPELHRTGGVTHTEKSNIFAFGIVLYEMMTGQLPYAGGTPTRMLLDIHEKEPRPPETVVKEIPPELSRICLRCLDKDPGRRFPNVAAVESSLRIAGETSALRVKDKPSDTAKHRASIAAKSTQSMPIARQRMTGKQVGLVVAALMIAAAAGALLLMPALKEEGREPDKATLGLDVLLEADGHIRAGRFQDAIRLLDAHRDRRGVDPTRFDDLYNAANLKHWRGRAETAEKAGRWAEAAQAFDQVLSFESKEARAELEPRRDSAAYRSSLSIADPLEAESNWEDLTKTLEATTSLASKLSLSVEEREKQDRRLNFARSMLEAAKARHVTDREQELKFLFEAARMRPQSRTLLQRLSELDSGPGAFEDLIGRAREALRESKIDDAASLAKQAHERWPLDERSQHVVEYVSDSQKCESHNMAIVSAKLPGGAAWGRSDREQIFCIDRFEFPGKKGEEPRTLVSAVEAASECEKRGARLCSLGEWQLACSGPNNRLFPYGGIYELRTCRTESNGPVKSGALAKCVSPFGVYDMSGNVAEWTSDSIPAGQMVAGGDWMGSSAQARCSSVSPFNSGLTSTRVGFRCCMHAVKPQDDAAAEK